jgi:hypothetical protein
MCYYLGSYLTKDKQKGVVSMERRLDDVTIENKDRLISELERGKCVLIQPDGNWESFPPSKCLSCKQGLILSIPPHFREGYLNQLESLLSALNRLSAKPAW